MCFNAVILVDCLCIVKLLNSIWWIVSDKTEDAVKIDGQSAKLPQSIDGALADIEYAKGKSDNPPEGQGLFRRFQDLELGRFGPYRTKR
jgi:hypothetical protein